MGKTRKMDLNEGEHDGRRFLRTEDAARLIGPSPLTLQSLRRLPQ
jgi:hypothetical protein